MALRVSCPSPVLRLFSSGEVGPVPSSPSTAPGRSPPCGLACSHKLALRAVGVAQGRPEGALLAWVWGVRGWALSHARPPVLAACDRGPLPTGCGCGGCGRGDLSPTPQGALLRAGFARFGAGTEAPGGGGGLLPRCGASGVGRSPMPDRPTLGRAAGARYQLALGAGGVGGGTRHRPHSARSWELALRAVRATRGPPGGGGICPDVGRPGVGALPRPTARPWGVRPQPATHLLWVRRMWAWGPVTDPTASALASWLCTLWGGTRAPGGRRRLLACGASRVGRSPTHDCPSLTHAAGARYPLAAGVGAVGVRSLHQPHSAPSCELILHAVGAAQGRPGRVPLAWGWGVRGRALFHARPPVLRACDRGPLPTVCGCPGCGPGDPSPTP